MQNGDSDADGGTSDDNRSSDVGVSHSHYHHYHCHRHGCCSHFCYHHCYCSHRQRHLLQYQADETVLIIADKCRFAVINSRTYLLRTQVIFLYFHRTDQNKVLHIAAFGGSIALVFIFRDNDCNSLRYEMQLAFRGFADIV